MGFWRNYHQQIMLSRLDLLISNFVPASSEARGLNFRSLAKKAVAVFGAPPFRHLRKAFPRSLSGMKFIFPTFDSTLREDVEHWFRLHAIAIIAAFAFLRGKKVEKDRPE